MRTGLALVSAALLGACGSSPGGGGDDEGGPDAAVEPPFYGFELKSPPVDITPGQEITYCWYFRTPNTESMAITKWTSKLPTVGHHMIVYTTTTDKMPVDTVSAVNCSGAAGGSLSNLAVWTYAAQEPTATLELPADDGTGTPLAIEIAANQAGFIQMHFKNSGDVTASASVELTGSALPIDERYTKTAAYVTYNGNISIPPLAQGHTQALSCTVPATSKFWLMTTHTHKQGIRTRVTDGGTQVYENLNWEHPRPERWSNETPFRTFESGKVTYGCTWNNPTGRTITTGDNSETDEVCMASGYFFPAIEPVFCFNTSIL